MLADACKIVKESSRKRVISGADEDGRVMVEFSEPVGGRRVKMLTPDEINGMLYKEETPESPAHAEEAMAEETEPPTAGQEESGESALERIPKDAQTGEPQYTQTDADTAWDAIVEQTEGDKDMARYVAESTMKAKEEALKKLESSEPKAGVTVTETIAAAKEHKAAIEAARQELEQWKAIAGVENRRKAEEKEKVVSSVPAVGNDISNGTVEVQSQPEVGNSMSGNSSEATSSTDKVSESSKTKQEKDAETGVKLSDEIDENGKPLVLAKDGTTTFGIMEPESGLREAPIQLSLGENYVGEDGKNHGYGLLHIEAGHGKQIRSAGFPSVEEFVEEVAKNYVDIREGAKIGNTQTYLLEMTDDHNNTLFVQLSKDGTYWNVNSAGIFNVKYSRRKPKVYSVPALGEDINTDTSEVDSDHSEGVTAPAGNSSKTSASKVSESPETKQEKAENSISARVKEASADVDTAPTEAQKEAGNYKKGHVQVGAFDITIEQPEGSIRRGTDADGRQWESKMHNTYGYFRGTEGVDGDHIDVFLSNDMDGWNGAQVFVVDQYNPDGTFDEHKVMLGFNDASDAKSNYLANYENGWENGRRIDVSAVSLADFEKWIAGSHRKTKPFSEYKSVKPADDSETFKGHKVENSGKDTEAHIKHLEEIKDYPGADKKAVQSEIDRLKAEKEELKAKSKNVQGTNKTGAFGTIYTQFKGKAKEAIAFLIEKKEGEAVGALHHKDIGDIDLVWGKEGTGKSDGFGLAKLVKYHPEVLDDLQEILDDMTVVKKNANRVQLESKTHKASVRLAWDKEKKNWLLTAYEKKNSASDNTTDTAETAMGGKRNDTATPQNTVSAGKVSESPETKQEKKEKSEEPKSEEKNSVDDAKIEAVSEALSKGDEKAEQLVQGLTNRELSKLRSKVKASPLLENEWLRRVRTRGDVSLHDRLLESQYVEPVKRVSGTFKMTDYITPKNDKEFGGRLSGVYHDDMGYAVASDGRILVADKGCYDPKQKGKVIGKDGAAIGDKFPNWQKVISTAKETKSSRIDAEDLHKFVAGVLKADKHAYISLRFPDGTTRAFNANRLNLMLRAMKRLGTDKLQYTKYGMKLVAKSDKGATLLVGLVSAEDELVEKYGYAYPGNTVLYHRGEVVGETSPEERVLRDAVIDRLRESGMEVITDEEAGQRVLDEANGKVRQMSFGEPYDYAAYPYGRVEPNLAEKEVNVVEADANHGFNNYKEAKTWAKQNVSKSYNDKETGGKGNVRISNAAIDKFLSQSAVDKSDSKDVHMAVLKVLPGLLKTSIDVETHPDFIKGEDGKRNAKNGINKDVLVHRCYGAVSLDGKLYRVKITLKEDPRDLSFPHVTHSYEATKIELLAGTWENRKSPSPNTSNSITAAKLLENVGMSYNPGEKVLTASEKRSANIREQRVYHGSGADFDRFDHSHMGEGEGAQAYGWGTYVTEVEGIGRTYAIQNTTKHNDALRALQHDVDAISDQLYRQRDDLNDDEEQLKRANEWRAEAELDYELFKDEAEKLKEKYGEASSKYQNHLFNDVYTDEMKRAQRSVESIEESIRYRKEKIAELEKALKDKQVEVDELPKKFPRHLYTVDIPDDTGENYLDWANALTDGQIERIRQYLVENYRRNKVEDFDASIAEVKDSPNAAEVNAWTRRGENVYKTLTSLLGTDKEVSKALSEMGFAGIKYPTDYQRGGREDGAKNYVIFNENDAKITDHVRFFKTKNGEAYGFTVGGKIYIDPKIANAETPIHEYAHLWAAALRGQNPKEWQNIVELIKGTSVWDEVKKRYPELNADDDIADEVLATYSGRRGAERLREEQRKIAGGKGGVFEKAEAISALERVKQALRKFWKSVADFLHIHYKSAEEVADRVMKDLLDGVDPGKHFNSRNDDPRFMFAGEKGAARADRGEEALTRQNNLDVAQKMEAAKEEAKAVKWATGWERGADGKWRYEIPDGIYHPKGDAELKKALAKQPWSEELNGLSDRILDGEELSKEETERFNELAEKEAAFKADYLKKEKPHLADWLENDELFKAYPELKRVGIVFTDNMPKEQAGYYDSKSNTITVNTNSSEDTASIIAHEVQHAIQRYEGFATGGNLKAAMEYLSGNKRADVKIKQQLAYKLSQEKGLGLSEEEVNSLIGHLEYEDISDDELQKQIDALCQKHNITEDQLEDIYPMDSVWHEAYNRISGEAEARNVQKRMSMTAEERRASLAADTEDVARDSQILLFDDKGKNMSLESPKEERIEKLRESKPVEITGNEYKGKYELNRESAKEWLKNNLRGEYRIKDTGETVELRKDGIQKVTSHSMGNEAHLKSLAAIPQMIENSIFIDEVPNEKNNGKYDRYRYYVCGLKIGGEDYTAKITIGVKGGYKYYDHSLTQIEKGSLLDNIDALSTTYDDKGTTLSSVGKDSRLLSILQVKDEKKPNRELYRAGSKELRDGRKIKFVRKPTATYNALARHLQAEGIKPDMHEARTGSRYMSFEKDGVQWEVRSSDHTKPEYYGEAQKPVELTYYKDKQGEENLSVSVDLGTSGYNIEDMKALMAEIDRLKNDAGEVKESFDRGVVSDEAAKRYPLLSQALGVKSENEVRAGEEAREHAEEARKQEMRSAVEDMAGRLHLNNVDIVDKPAERGAGRRERAKGMFERSTGRITINTGNCADKRDAVVTLLHEAVAHHGLRKLFGENFETFLDNVYNSANAEIHRIIDKHSSRYGGDKRTATEEYMASLAERTGFENAKKSGWWQRIKDFFLKMLEKIGLKGFKGEDLSDNELRYVLWRSYENLKSGGKDTVFSAADDLAKQSELKVGEFAPGAKKTAPEENAEEVNERFNEQLGGLTADNADNVVLSLGRPSKVLLSAGVENKPMTLYGNKVIKKMRKHGFALEELRNLPRAVADPIAVFNNYGENGNRSILTELKTLRGNFLVSVNIGKGADVDFNIVSSVFGKGSGNVADWINKGYMTYVDKEKALNYLHHSALRAVTSDSSRLSSEDPAVLPPQSAPIAATAANAEFSSAAKIVENFENPKPESKNDVLFRDGAAKDYEKAQARETYERRVRAGMFQSREAIQDSMLSLKVAMDAIEEATAGKAKRIEDYDGFENAYLGENRLSSVNQAESAAFAHLLIRPMMEEVNRLAPTAEDRAELIDYMFAKHGLERNAYMRQQAAEKKLAEYKKQNPGTAKTAADFIDAERDYAGLTTLTGEADVSAAEAEAQRMVVEYEKDHTFHGTWNEIYVCRKKIC